MLVIQSFAPHLIPIHRVYGFNIRIRRCALHVLVFFAYTFPTFHKSQCIELMFQIILSQ